MGLARAEPPDCRGAAVRLRWSPVMRARTSTTSAATTSLPPRRQQAPYQMRVITGRRWSEAQIFARAPRHWRSAVRGSGSIARSITRARPGRTSGRDDAKGNAVVAVRGRAEPRESSGRGRDTTRSAGGRAERRGCRYRSGPTPAARRALRARGTAACPPRSVAELSSSSLPVPKSIRTMRPSSAGSRCGP